MVIVIVVSVVIVVVTDDDSTSAWRSLPADKFFPTKSEKTAIDLTASKSKTEEDEAEEKEE